MPFVAHPLFGVSTLLSRAGRGPHGSRDIAPAQKKDGLRGLAVIRDNRFTQWMLLITQRVIFSQQKEGRMRAPKIGTNTFCLARLDAEKAL